MDDESTESASVSSPEIRKRSHSPSMTQTVFEPKFKPPVNISEAPAVVAWTTADGSTEHLRLALNLHRDTDANTVSVRLSTRVALRGPTQGKRKTTLYLFLCRIRILAVIDNDDDHDHDNSLAQAQKMLGGTSVCALSLVLNQPGDLVAPIAHTSLEPKYTDVSIVDGLNELARQTSFVVYIAAKTVPKTTLQSLCEAVTARRVTLRKADLPSLYGGKGGHIIRPRVPKSREEEIYGEPPMYSNLGPSPPGIPHASSSSHSRGKKRQRVDADDSSIGNVDDDKPPIVGLEDVCRRILTHVDRGFESIHGTLKALDSRLDRLERRLDELEVPVPAPGDPDDNDEEDVLFERIDEKIKEEIGDAKNGLFLEIGDQIKDAKRQLKGKVQEWVGGASLVCEFSSQSSA